MGQKTHPIGFRLGLKQNWSSKWFSLTDFKKYLNEDIKIRRFLNNKLKSMGLSRIEIERSIKQTKVTLFVSKPGLVIGRGGAGIDSLKQDLVKITGQEKIKLAVTEVKKPFLSAQIIAEEIASQIVRRIPEKRILKGTIEKVVDAGAKGVKVAIRGRIAGQEIARTIHKTAGSIPLQNLIADIDFATSTAFTKYGTTGVKVWIYKGDTKKAPKTLKKTETENVKEKSVIKNDKTNK